MAYIYKITNDINGKGYIGKTHLSVEKRWTEHRKDAKKENKECRPLYKAIRKYGEENFSVVLLEEVNILEAVEREKYWIDYYNTFKVGYNATQGGDGKPYIDYELVIQTYLKMQNCREVARSLGISNKSVENILKLNQILITSGAEVIRKFGGKRISMYSQEDKHIRDFISQHEAARWLISNNLSYGKPKDIARHIGQATREKRYTAYGFKWKQQ